MLCFLVWYATMQAAAGWLQIPLDVCLRSIEESRNISEKVS
jgi:hypothetical protein